MTKKALKTILITGTGGFIGSNFLKFANKEYSKSNRFKILSSTRKNLDITNSEQLKRFFGKYSPEIIVNFAAHRDANSAELQRGDRSGSVWKTNVKGVENLSKLSKEYGSFMIHISTDMVFSGNKDNPGPYSEHTKPGEKIENLSWYGWTKAEGERRIISKKNTAVVRIGNVTLPIYDPKLDYLGKILYLHDKKMLYPLFNDQQLTLTYVPSLFQVIKELIKNKTGGKFHVASTNIFTPQEIAEYLIRKTRLKTKKVKGISIDEYLKQFPHRYPKHGGLLTRETQKKLNLKFLTWNEIIDMFISPKLK